MAGVERGCRSGAAAPRARRAGACTGPGPLPGLHFRHTKRGPVAQALAPAGAVLVLACTAFGGSGVLAAGLVCALMVTVGVPIHSRVSRA
ncbi:hypothetical protein ACH4E7_18620 [Kitasatospora sp. NPDC018058]|uniref:hypothetical protein n=1 Tax=Kitasatospora sp. NPDC018058 TaxID=3364025 RepID=UPI0037BEB6D5